MKTINQRIKNIIGQLQGVDKMLSEDQVDCLKVITQLKAARSAVSSLMEKYLESEFDCCLYQAKGQNKEQLKKIVAEMVKSK
ncbi:MAG TPA: metal-sensitive transcriptional regulator [bacterium]|nr:metal-sensitive transcriptional regulator [bacterium]HPT29766.1 metal-sensitive transcriptional regulator [bacterium]